MTTLQIGDKAPDFKAIDEEGNIRQLADYKGKKISFILLSQSKYSRMYHGSIQFKRPLSRICRKGI